MRTILSAFALLFFAASAMAQSRITLLITFTNAPTTSNTITINGVTRTWTNAATSTTILTNLVSANGSKTNLFSQFSRWWTFSGPLNLVDVGTNSFKVVGTLGGALSASVNQPYAVLTLSTQSGTATYTALYPLENMSDMTDRVNEASSLVYGLGTYSTNAFATNSAAISNTLIKGASPLQRVQGPVLFNSVGGTNSGLTNGVYKAPTLIDPVIPAGAVAGHVLTTDGSGVATWQAATGGGGGSATNVKYGIGQTLLLDATFGDDSTAGRTNTSTPYLQASNAVSAILSGDTLRVRGGTYLINPKTDPVTSLVGIRANTSAGLAITNRINFSISGEPGVIWQMSGRDFIGTTSACPMLTLSHCTNAVLENFTLSGIYTNGKVFQDFAIMLDQCENITLRNLTFSNWMNQGITDGGVSGASSFTSNRLHKFINLKFIRMGGTNQCTMGLDGAAISVNCSNSLFSGLTFIDCWREIEFYGFGSVRNNTFENCYTYGNRYQSFVFEALDMRDMQIIDCHAMGYSTDLYNVGAGIPEATWLDLWGGSNITIRGCTVGGMTGFGWSTAGHTPSYDLIDCTIQGCTFDDVSYRAIFALQYAGYPAKVERLRIVGNTFRNTLYPPITFTGNNSVVKDNEFWDCNTVNVPTGVIIAGYLDATYATNSTNITISGNNITSTDIAQRPFADGIIIWSECYSNVVFGNNVDGRFYRTNIHNVGVGTRTRPVNLVAVGSLLRSDAAGDERAVTIGSGITFDGTTLSSSGGGGTGTVAAGQSVVIVTNGSVGTVHVGSNDLRMSITNRVIFSNGVALAISATAPTNNRLHFFNIDGATTPELVFNNEIATGSFEGPSLKAGTGAILELWNTYSTNLGVFRARSIHLTNGATANAFLVSVDTTGIAEWRTNLNVDTLTVNRMYVTNVLGYSVDEFGTMTITNLVSPLIVADQIQYKMPTINVGSANSNQTVWLGETNTVNMFLTNAVTFTNFSTVTSTRSATYLAQIRVVSSTNVNVNWGLGIGYGGQVRTNANNPIWTVLTNGAYYLASWTAFGTNRVLRVSLEQ